MLNKAQIERLVLLNEECAEVQQIISKILRHGYESYNPNDYTINNRGMLQREIGDMFAALELMQSAKDVHLETILNYKMSKLQRVYMYLHHQKRKKD